MRRIEYSEDILKEIEKLSKEGKGYKSISKYLNLSGKAVFRIMKENNWLHPKRYVQRKHKIDETIFEKIDTEEKAYWLGFIYADGNVCKRTLSVRQKGNKDGYNHLLKLKSFLGVDNKIETGIQNSWGVETPYCRLSVYSKKIVEDLKQKGCVPKKSLILTFPSKEILPENLRYHFIRGYFDGDGGFLTGKNNGIAMSFNGTKEFLEKVREILGVNCVPKQDKRHLDKNIYQLSFGGKFQVYQIGSKLYDNNHISLDRKNNLFKKFKESYKIRYQQLLKEKQQKEN